MDPVLMHLVINHVPIIGTILALGIVLVALVMKNDTVKRTGLILFVATGTASELAKGVGSQVKQGFQERVSETTGGKLAASIRESMEPKEASQSGQFEGNSLGADSGPDSNEVRS